MRRAARRRKGRRLTGSDLGRRPSRQASTLAWTGLGLQVWGSPASRVSDARRGLIGCASGGKAGARRATADLTGRHGGGPSTLTWAEATLPGSPCGRILLDARVRKILLAARCGKLSPLWPAHFSVSFSRFFFLVLGTFYECSKPVFSGFRNFLEGF